MHRAPAENRLHIDEPIPMPGDWIASAAREVAWYLTCDPSWQERKERTERPDRDECIRTRREALVDQ
jgi:hypothetical protein